MVMEQSTEQLCAALFEPNQALKKRALALIFRQARVEARPEIERFLTQETAPDLIALGVRVLEQLRRRSGEVLTAAELASGLAAPDPVARRRALRQLLERPEPTLVRDLARFGQSEDDPDNLVLMLDIFQRHPAGEHLGMITGLLAHGSERVRQMAVSALIRVILGALFPKVLASLLDPAPPVKMVAHRFVSSLARVHLVEALGAMLEAGGEAGGVGARLLPSFLAADLLPHLHRALANPDGSVRDRARAALVLLEQRGNPEAACLLEELDRPMEPAADAADAGSCIPRRGDGGGASSAVGSDDGAIELQVTDEAAPVVPAAAAASADAGDGLDLEVTDGEVEVVSANWAPEDAAPPASGSRPPEWLVRRLLRARDETDPGRAYHQLAGWVTDLSEFLGIGFLVAYLARGRRDPDADRLALGAIHFGLGRVEITRLLAHLAERLPPPRNRDDLFPLQLAASIRQAEEETPLLARLVELREGLVCIQEYPDRTGELVGLAQASAGALVEALAPVFSNRLVYRHTRQDQLRIVDLMPPQPTAVDDRTINAERFEVNRLVLASRDLAETLPLFPFYRVDAATLAPQRNQPGDQELWDVLRRFGALDDFMTYLFSVVRQPGLS